MFLIHITFIVHGVLACASSLSPLYIYITLFLNIKCEKDEHFFPHIVMRQVAQVGFTSGAPILQNHLESGPSELFLKHKVYMNELYINVS